MLLVALVVIAVPAALSSLAWPGVGPLPEPEIYFEAGFDRAPVDWSGLDYTWLEPEGVIRLAYRDYAAPHLYLKLSPEQSPPAGFVWRLRVFVSAFTDEGVVLGSLFFPHGPLALAVNRDGCLGIARDLFAPPVYGSAPRLALNQWQELLVHCDTRKREVTVYLGSRPVLTEPLLEPVFPVQEVWLGAVWLKGGGNYGAPLDILYSGTALGNEGLLQRRLPPVLAWLADWLHLGRTAVQSLLR